MTAKIAKYNCKFMLERLKIYNLADVGEIPEALKDYLCQKNNNFRKFSLCGTIL